MLSVEGRPVPVVAALRTDVLAPLAAAFTSGRRRADELLAVPGVVIVDVGPDRAPVDLDDPADLARWLARPGHGGTDTRH